MPENANAAEQPRGQPQAETAHRTDIDVQQQVDSISGGTAAGVQLNNVQGQINISVQQFGAPQPPKTPPKPRQSFEPETVQVPAGPFLMGSLGATGTPAEETPQVFVMLPTYFISRAPITNALYAVFVRQTGAPVAPESGWKLAAVGQEPAAGAANHPVVGVTWDEANAYCRWLSAMTGRHYRLPTEAEWEKAARGDDGRRYPWGEAFDPANCNAAPAGRGAVAPAGSYSPRGDSPFGCVDMAGNVWEWTSTVWGRDYATLDYPYPYRADDGREMQDLKLPGGHRELRICRGGSFRDNENRVTCTVRARYAADSRHPARGFRVVCEEEGSLG